MFRWTPNACTRRNMLRHGRVTLRWTKGGKEPVTHLRLLEVRNRHVNLEQIEHILLTMNRKEITQE